MVFNIKELRNFRRKKRGENGASRPTDKSPSACSSGSLLIYLGVAILSLMFLFIGNKVASGELRLFDNGEVEILEARVLELTDRVQDEYQMSDGTLVINVDIYFTALITRGQRKGATAEAVQTLSSYFQVNSKEIAQGDNVLIMLNQGEWMFLDYVRIYKITWLGALFVAALIIFGRIKGFNAIFALGLTCAAIFMIFIPSVFTGRNIYASAIIVCVYAILSTIFIVSGINGKSLAAVLGCLFGTAATGVIAVVMDKILNLTGVVDQETSFLLFLDVDKPIDLRAVIFAAIIIGAVGAIMDVAMSISSSLWEVHKKARDISFAGLWESGINIGRDIMGTMANTLILAYISGALAVVLLLAANSYSFTELVNQEMIIVELLQMFASSLGILLTIPFTSLMCSALYLKRGLKTQAE
ncbi:MAG: YibE/F family protein [Clostridiales bacterium]|jgi:uncharacterized membrane protein|nr:YibE/F family protein [Clostridiales bacterium]